MERIDIHPVADSLYYASYLIGRLFEEILIAWNHRLIGHPDDHRFNIALHLGGITGMDKDVSPAYIDLIFKGHRDSLGWEGLFEIAVKSNNLLYPALLLPRQHHHLITGTHDTRGYRAGKPPEVDIGTVDVLNWKAEINEVPVGADIDRFEVVEEGARFEPLHLLAFINYVVTIEGRYGDKVKVADFKSRREGCIVIAYRVKNLLIKSNKVHLVNRDNDVLYPEESADKAVPLRLRQYPVSCVDEDDG